MNKTINFYYYSLYNRLGYNTFKKKKKKNFFLKRNKNLKNKKFLKSFF